MNVEFVKMHGLGNDYVYFDCFRQPIPEPFDEFVRWASDRRFGIGGDGVILICPPDQPGSDARMRMYNADASEGEMCGNGVRCVAKYVHDSGIAAKSELLIETGRGVLNLENEIEDGRVRRVRVNMDEPILEGRLIPSTFDEPRVVEREIDVAGRSFPVTLVSMGNPHAVVFLDEPPNDDWVLGVGKAMESASHLFPNRINAEFVHVEARDRLKMRVWERGSGETFACGTGACAVAVAAVLTGRADRRATVSLLGGDLDVEWAEANNCVYMTGAANETFRGACSWPPVG